MKRHPLQSGLFDELHNRPFPLLSSPASISHVIMLNPGDRSAEINHLKTLAAQYSVALPADDASCYYQRMGEFEFRWERHTEFSSYAVILPRTGSAPFSENAISILPENWLAELPGEMLGGDHIELRSDWDLDTASADLHKYFDGHSLIGGRVLDDKAVLWAALRSHSDGFSRCLIFTENDNVCECGRLVRSLIELSAYRNLTLIALPVARNLIPVVSEMEQQLAQLSARLTDSGNYQSEKQLLDELSVFAAKLEQLVSEHNTRFAATEAYYQLCEDRLGELQESELENLRTLRAFHHRRFRPGFSTCQSVRQRMNELSVRVNRATSLLRTRVDLVLEAQNQDLLRSMNTRAKLQLRMQQTVEGLSIIAITHYTLSLLGYLLKGVPKESLLLPSDTLLALSTPVIFIGAWLSIRRIRQSMTERVS